MNKYKVYDLRFDQLPPVVIEAENEVKAKIKYFNDNHARALFEGENLKVVKYD